MKTVYEVIINREGEVVIYSPTGYRRGGFKTVEEAKQWVDDPKASFKVEDLRK